MARWKPTQPPGRRAEQGRWSRLSRPGLGAGAQPLALRSRSPPRAGRSGGSDASVGFPSVLAGGRGTLSAPGRPGPALLDRLETAYRHLPMGLGLLPVPSPGPGRRAPVAPTGWRGVGRGDLEGPRRRDVTGTAPQGDVRGPRLPEASRLPRESLLRIGIGERSGAARSQPGRRAQWFPLGTPARPPLLPVRGGTTWAASG
ncbi:uncharacterized protein LOC118171006 [Oxyura jamaicensis]|uniref:uncharacterized protein LOC118171006 n=1 Tax=Oxyura jamaicensis TaxID=8884 RepID=UPI0015A67F87|nr:uncharacterized protein LOC118171006 [Oxyura jamaicensis]